MSSYAEADQSPIPGAAIVLEGWFYPGIVHPRWFLQQGILTTDETEWAEGREERPPRTGVDFSEFEAPGFLFTCQRRSLRVASTVGAPEFNRLAEVLFATLEHLPHMPARAVSMTRSLHLPLGAQK